jgi:hypothetical protein
MDASSFDMARNMIGMRIIRQVSYKLSPDIKILMNIWQNRF